MCPQFFQSAYYPYADELINIQLILRHTGKEFATEFQQAKVLKKLLKNIEKLLKNTEIMP